MFKGSRLPVMLLLCASGCTLFSKGHTNIEYTQALGTTTMTHAAKDGQYALYVNNDPIPAVVQILKQGQALGFERNDEDRIRAVAGDYSTILPRATSMAKWATLPKH